MPATDRENYLLFCEGQDDAFGVLLRILPHYLDELKFKIQLSQFEKKLDRSFDIPSVPDSTMRWKGEPSKLKLLYEFLIRDEYISNIDFRIFEGHFNGKKQNIPINWISKTPLLPELLDSLMPYLSTHFYQSSGKCKPAMVVIHFSVKGNTLKAENLSNYKKKSTAKMLSEFKQKFNQVFPQPTKG